MTALENVTLPMTFAGVRNETAIEKGMELLELVGLGRSFSTQAVRVVRWPAAAGGHRTRPGQ